MTNEEWEGLPLAARERLEAIARAVDGLAPEVQAEVLAAAAWLAVQVRTGMLSAMATQLVLERSGIGHDLEGEFALASIRVCTEYAAGWTWLNAHDRPMRRARP